MTLPATIGSVHVIGRGRVGSAFAARLADRGLLADDAGRDAAASSVRVSRFAGSVDVVLLCVPDRSIADVAGTIAPGPWLLHVSGATPLAALAPHVKRASMHPLQTFTRSRGADQIDGAWAAVSGETDEALSVGRALAGALGLRPFDLPDGERVLYHAGAVIASNFLVTLHRAAAAALTRAGAPPEALEPLMRRTIENDFELTGPIARGDTATVDAHLAAIRRDLPEIEALYRALAAATRP
jgi:predicted short-subunit dehydrogenase-like oxidoreductase (DUF2520 family)